MDIANSKTGTLPGEATWTEGRNTALVGELSQGIGLIHELAQLTGAKEFLNRRHEGLWIHQLSWSE